MSNPGPPARPALEVPLPEDLDPYEAVPLDVRFFAFLNRPDAATDLVEWYCRVCRVGGDANDIPEFLAQFSAHLYRHHRKGPGKVIP